MSEHVFKFYLSELEMVRVHCKSEQCPGVVEIPLKALETAYSSGVCPLCKAMIQPAQIDANALWRLGRAIRELKDCKASVELEFCLPAKP